MGFVLSGLIIELNPQKKEDQGRLKLLRTLLKTYKRRNDIKLVNILREQIRLIQFNKYKRCQYSRLFLKYRDFFIANFKYNKLFNVRNNFTLENNILINPKIITNYLCDEKTTEKSCQKKKNDLETRLMQLNKVKNLNKKNIKNCIEKYNRLNKKPRFIFLDSRRNKHNLVNIILLFSVKLINIELAIIQYKLFIK